MKFNIILSIITLLAGYATCKNLKKTPVDQGVTTMQTQPAPVGNEGNYPFPSSNVINGERADTAPGTFQVKRVPRHVDVPWDQITKPSTSRRAFMATGWWYPKMAYQPSDTTVHLNYLGKWLKFKDDLSQTFDLYIDGKVIETGHWGYDDTKKIMYISCKDPYFNNSWRVQERGFRMVWIGNTDINVTGIQVRMDNDPTPPWGK